MTRPLPGAEFVETAIRSEPWVLPGDEIIITIIGRAGAEPQIFIGDKITLTITGRAGGTIVKQHLVLQPGAEVPVDLPRPDPAVVGALVRAHFHAGVDLPSSSVLVVSQLVALAALTSLLLDNTGVHAGDLEEFFKAELDRNRGQPIEEIVARIASDA